jgi:YD repeat-containing protein
MKLLASVAFFLLAVALSGFVPTGLTARNNEGQTVLRYTPDNRVLYHASTSVSESSEKYTFPSSTGIKEDIPDKYKKRYNAWKSEFLSTETGRQQWESYSNNDRFLLTITIARGNENGAGTKYKWDDNGQLISAMIALGSRLDEGYPNPIYYPVMNSLAPSGSSYVVSGNILAATKLAHEFGHVNRMAMTDGALYKLQNQLIPLYNQILLSNGHNTKDPKLIELAQRMGGTPVEIWEDREYWGETNAMLYLRDRITKESFQCTLFTKINRSLALYAKSYIDRFAQIAQQSRPTSGHCTWQ